MEGCPVVIAMWLTKIVAVVVLALALLGGCTDADGDGTPDDEECGPPGETDCGTGFLP
jgi:hypothetical protein